MGWHWEKPHEPGQVVVGTWSQEMLEQPTFTWFNAAGTEDLRQDTSTSSLWRVVDSLRTASACAAAVARVEWIIGVPIVALTANRVDGDNCQSRAQQGRPLRQPAEDRGVEARYGVL